VTPRLPPHKVHPLQAGLLALLILLLASLSSCAFAPALEQVADALSKTPTVTPRSAKKATATPTVKRKATATPKRKPSATPTPQRKATATRAADGLDTVTYKDLPGQAKDTIRLIEAGGPFPYRQDGVVFQNREGILPKKPSGYYHEYTVITPGSPDRGARRIVMGEDGTMYYTDDHYDTFRRIIR
jgi:ribonuclease T1